MRRGECGKGQAREGGKRREKVRRKVEKRSKERELFCNLGLVCGLLSDDGNDGGDVCSFAFHFLLFMFASFHCFIRLIKS